MAKPGNIEIMVWNDAGVRELNGNVEVFKRVEGKLEVIKTINNARINELLGAMHEFNDDNIRYISLCVNYRKDRTKKDGYHCVPIGPI